MSKINPPAELSIDQATTWSSSFMCTAERNAISSFLNARSERCWGYNVSTEESQNA